MINLDEAKVTHIQFFEYAQKIQTSEDGDYEEKIEYSANVVINDSFLIQLSGNEDEAHRASIPHSSECFWNDRCAQDFACENIDIDDLISFLERSGIENNYHYLSENGDSM
jgi:hypothetical protein